MDKIDNFFQRSFKFGLTSYLNIIPDIIRARDKLLFEKVCVDGHILHDLLLRERTRLLREREHGYLLQRVHTERYKNAFVNRCLFHASHYYTLAAERTFNNYWARLRKIS